MNEKKRKLYGEVSAGNETMEGIITVNETHGKYSNQRAKTID